MCRAPPVAIYYQTESALHAWNSRAAGGCFLEQVMANNSSTLRSAKISTKIKTKNQKRRKE
jgi:hypothetical protein